MRKRTALKSRMGALVINPRKKATRKRNPRRSTKRRYGASHAHRMTKRPVAWVLSASAATPFGSAATPFASAATR